jgi:hypothetical protein
VGTLDLITHRDTMVLKDYRLLNFFSEALSKFNALTDQWQMLFWTWRGSRPRATNVRVASRADRQTGSSSETSLTHTLPHSLPHSSTVPTPGSQAEPSATLLGNKVGPANLFCGKPADFIQNGLVYFCPGFVLRIPYSRILSKDNWIKSIRMEKYGVPGI